MKKTIIISKPIKNINLAGESLVIELDSGIISVGKPLHIGFYSRSGIIDQKDVYFVLGLLFIYLVLGAFMDYFNIAPLIIWYTITLFISGISLLIVLLVPKRRVLIIETIDRIIYFTRSQHIDYALVKEIIFKIYSTGMSQQDSLKTIREVIKNG